MSTLAPSLKSGDDKSKFLPVKWVDFLIQEDETGPNYHLVDITLTDGQIIPSVVIANCQYLSDKKEAWNNIDVSQIAQMKVKRESSS